VRLRCAVPIGLLATLAGAALPGVASAAPASDHGLTSHTFPDPSLAREEIVVQGRLTVAPVGEQKIILYHHNAGSTARYKRYGVAMTDAQGYYQFVIKPGPSTNQTGFVVEDGHRAVHSRLVYQRVQALVSITADPANADTLQPVRFTGHVTPDHRFGRVLLQAQEGSSADFRTIKDGRLDAGSNYSISYRFRRPGVRDLRVLLPGDLRNIASPSDPVSVTIQQRQNPSFTISSSSPITVFNTPVTISGTLYEPGTMTPEGNTSVTLHGRSTDQSFRSLGSTTTASNGSYSFTQSPTRNELYYVATTLPPRRHTAPLLEGVRDEVTLMATTSAASKSVTAFVGQVTPYKGRKTICLQRLGTDGDYDNVKCKAISTSSTYEFVRTVFDTGTFRTRVFSDRFNLGNVSPTVTVNGGLPPASTAPTSS